MQNKYKEEAQLSCSVNYMEHVVPVTRTVTKKPSHWRMPREKPLKCAGYLRGRNETCCPMTWNEVTPKQEI